MSEHNLVVQSERAVRPQAAADVDGDGVIDQDDIDFILFCFGLPQDDPNCGMDVEQFARADFNSNGVIDQDDLDAVLFYFGVTISETLSARLSWDGENRLTRWEPRVPRTGSKKVDFRYDYRNRRVEKRVSTFSGSAWAVSDVRRFIWSDWLPLAELKGDPNDPNEPNKYKVERYYTWGLDLAGLSGSVNSLQSAGGMCPLNEPRLCAGVGGGHDAAHAPANLFDRGVARGF